MSPLIIEASAQTPEIILDKKTNTFIFKGKSLPENPIFFYDPVLKWLDDYIANPNSETNVNFMMAYFNTSSSKIFLDILKRLELIKNSGNEVRINWLFKEDDEDMFEAGEIYSERVDIPFNLIPDDNIE
jgi:hypothetical protein